MDPSSQASVLCHKSCSIRYFKIQLKVPFQVWFKTDWMSWVHMTWWRNRRKINCHSWSHDEDWWNLQNCRSSKKCKCTHSKRTCMSWLDVDHRKHSLHQCHQLACQQYAIKMSFQLINVNSELCGVRVKTASFVAHYNVGQCVHCLHNLFGFWNFTQIRLGT